MSDRCNWTQLLIVSVCTLGLALFGAMPVRAVHVVHPPHPAQVLPPGHTQPTHVHAPHPSLTGLAHMHPTHVHAPHPVLSTHAPHPAHTHPPHAPHPVLVVR